LPDVEVLAEAPIYPTEDPERVRRALENILPGAELEVRGEGPVRVLVARARGREALSKLRAMVRMERISDAFRAALLAGLRPWGLEFYLNKQAAYARRLSLSEPKGESPLGPIRNEVRCPDPEGLVDWLAPRTG